MKINKNDNLIVCLTGAGISKESGLDTFRDKGGVWDRVNLEDVATPQGFVRDPKYVHEFYNYRRKELLSVKVKPNVAHYALAKLEEEYGNFVLITQNIDNLHSLAGSKSVIYMHGEILKIRCESCSTILEWKRDLSCQESCYKCHKVGRLRPHVVWFGEMPLELDKIYKLLNECSVFISIGTSGNVYPAAGFVREVANNSKNSVTIEANLESSQGAGFFDKSVYGKATKIVPSLVKQILEEKFI